MEFEGNTYKTLVKSISIFFRVWASFTALERQNGSRSLFVDMPGKMKMYPCRSYYSERSFLYYAKVNIYRVKGSFNTYIFQPLIESSIEILWKCKRKPFNNSNIVDAEEKRKCTNLTYRLNIFISNEYMYRSFSYNDYPLFK